MRFWALIPEISVFLNGLAAQEPDYRHVPMTRASGKANRASKRGFSMEIPYKNLGHYAAPEELFNNHSQLGRGWSAIFRCLSAQSPHGYPLGHANTGRLRQYVLPRTRQQTLTEVLAQRTRTATAILMEELFGFTCGEPGRSMPPMMPRIDCSIKSSPLLLWSTQSMAAWKSAKVPSTRGSR